MRKRISKSGAKGTLRRLPTLLASLACGRLPEPRLLRESGAEAKVFLRRPPLKRMTTVFREMLQAPGVLHAPIAYDPLSARIAESVGFRCLDIGGYALGASSCVPEPLLSLEEVLMATRRITAAVSIPVMVDGGAGYGDAVHVIRTVRELERAGAAAVHIEDQVYPKRVHYHKGLEHVIPAEEMCEKIRYAVRARRDPDFVIAARTDAMISDSFAEGIRRANM